MANIIGIDGGGTKTSFCLLNTTENRKNYLKSGETNFKNIGIEKTKINMESGLQEILKLENLEIKDIDCFVLGAAGCDTEKDYEVFKDILENIGIKDNVFIYNDAKIAFKSCSGKDGIIIISGTGSISFSYNQNKENRLGGWGAEISDIGSGYWVGRKFLKDLLLYLENLYPKDEIFQGFIEKYIKNSDPFEYIQENFTDVKSIASVTEYVLTAESKYTDKISHEIAEFFYTVIEKLYGDFNGRKIDLVLSGSVIKNKKIYGLLEEKILHTDKMKNINIILNNKEAVEGCLNLALEILNPKGDKYEDISTGF
jgi:glucosamine kinase